MSLRMLQACVDTHGVDGRTGRHIMAVDGMPNVQAAIVTLLNCTVRNGLVEPFRHPFRAGSSMPIDPIVADAIDRAITIEMRFAAGLPRGVTEPLYRAARQRHGVPLTWLAAT